MRSSIRLKHLNPSGHFASGNARYYFRPKGQKGIPMPDLPPDDPRFLAAYAEAAGEIPRAPVAVGSIAEAIQDYLASATFKNLAVSTRTNRRRMLEEMALHYGSGRLRDLRAEHIESDMAGYESHGGVNRLKVWRGLCNWLAAKKRTSKNLAKGVAKPETPDSDGHIPWSREEVERYRAHWPIGSRERLALELLYWTAARVSDMVLLGERSVDDDGWLTFKQQKTGNDVSVPFNRALPKFAEGMADDLAFLKATIAARTDRHITFYTTQRGAPRSSKSVSQWFAKTARAAGLKNRTAHGLRKSRAIALAEAYATGHQIAAWTGHETLREIERYTKKFDRRRVLMRSEGERESSNSANPVPNATAEGK